MKAFSIQYSKWLGWFCILFLTKAVDGNCQSPTSSIETLFAKVDHFYETESIDSVLHYLQSILPIAIEQKEGIAECRVYAELGYVYALLEQHEQSLNHFKKALDCGLIHLANDSTFLADQYYYLAYTTDLLGDFDQSINYLKASLKLSIGTKQALARAETLNGIANIYFRKNDYDQALDYQEQALLIFQQYGEKAWHSIATTYDEIGLLWYFKQDYEQAYTFGRKAIELVEKQSDLAAEVLIGIFNNYALTLIQLNRFAEADQYLSKAHQLHLNQSENRYLEITQFNQAFLQFKKGVLSEAERNFQKVINLYRKKFANGHTNIGKAYYYLGQISAQKQAYEKAASNCQLALEQLVPDFRPSGLLDNPNSDLYTRSSRNLMRSLAAKASSLKHLYPLSSTQHQEMIPAIFQTYDQAVEVSDQMRKAYKAEGSRYFLAEETRPLFEEAIDYCYDLYTLSQDKAYIDKVLFYIEKSQAPLLMQSRQALQEQYLGGVPASLLAKVRQTAVDLAYYRNLWSKAKSQADSSKTQLYAHYYFENKQLAEDLQAELKANYPNFFRFDHPVVQVADLQNALSSSSTYLQYFQSAEAIYILAIDPNTVQFKRLSKVQAISSAIDSLQTMIAHPPTTTSYRPAAIKDFATKTHFLYQHLLAPILSEQQTLKKQLTIVANGELLHLPFELLLSSPSSLDQQTFLDLDYLFQKYSFSYQGSASLFLNLKQQQSNSAKHQILALAPFASTALPGHSNNKPFEWPSLPYTQSEVQQINQHFNCKTIVDQQASKAQFLKEVTQYRCLHLATHAQANRQAAANACLVFHGASKKADFLYNYEIQNLQLNAELVVLSACETGAGKIDRGEGVLSLARAFFYTGVPSVVMTRWPINDQSSSFLVGRFYQALKAGKTKDQALQEAKLHYLQEQADAISAHPFYWAGFTQLGHNAPLNLPASNRWWMGFVFFLILLLGWGISKKV